MLPQQFDTSLRMPQTMANRLGSGRITRLDRLNRELNGAVRRICSARGFAHHSRFRSSLGFVIASFRSAFSAFESSDFH
jgi:hypothetical protein